MFGLIKTLLIQCSTKLEAQVKKAESYAVDTVKRLDDLLEAVGEVRAENQEGRDD